jgi:hypothetical protein
MVNQSTTWNASFWAHTLVYALLRMERNHETFWDCSMCGGISCRITRRCSSLGPVVRSSHATLSAGRSDMSRWWPRPLISRGGYGY